MKRLIDIVLAAAILIVTSPAFLVLLVLIPRQSPGPAIFAQTRVGLRERPFTLLKFRTMFTEAPEKPSHEVGRSHVTPFGNFLRASKLDELPQLINVLRGEMSLVGPRPCLPSQTELVEARRRLGVYELRPGITGVAQIRGIDMSVPSLLARTDAEYIGRQGLWTDLRILFATFAGRGRGDRTVL